MMVSGRYVVPIALLFGLASIPTLIHGYVGLVVDDGRRTSAVGPVLAGMHGVDSKRPASWVRELYGSDDFVERDYSSVGGRPIRLFVARSYDAKKLYHHPELGVLRGRGFGRGERRRFGVRADIPVTVLRHESDGPGLALYAVKYGDQFIDNPVLFQGRAALRMLVSGRRLTTLFLTADLQAPPEQNVENSDAFRVLVAAVEAFERP